MPRVSPCRSRTLAIRAAQFEAVRKSQSAVPKTPPTSGAAAQSSVKPCASSPARTRPFDAAVDTAASDAGTPKSTPDATTSCPPAATVTAVEDWAANVTLESASVPPADTASAALPLRVTAAASATPTAVKTQGKSRVAVAFSAIESKSSIATPGTPGWAAKALAAASALSSVA